MGFPLAVSFPCNTAAASQNFPHRVPGVPWHWLLCLWSIGGARLTQDLSATQVMRNDSAISISPIAFEHPLVVSRKTLSGLVIAKLLTAYCAQLRGLKGTSPRIECRKYEQGPVVQREGSEFREVGCIFHFSHWHSPWKTTFHAAKLWFHESPTKLFWVLVDFEFHGGAR